MKKCLYSSRLDKMTINFTKMVASGNDFVVSEVKNKNYPVLAKSICNRKYGAGADGLLILGKSRVADIKMRIFNADGSEAEMCGNGARCAALYAGRSCRSIETKAGIIKTQVTGNNVKIKLTDPKGARTNIPIKVRMRNIKVNFINTGVPHVVIFVEGLEKIDLCEIAPSIRFHSKFSPAGANVNLVEVLKKNSIKIRTYERGVEDETLACGTGSVASALIFSLKTGAKDKILVHTRGKEVLKVYFKKSANSFSDVWLEGKAGAVYKGAYYV